MTEQLDKSKFVDYDLCAEDVKDHEESKKLISKLPKPIASIYVSHAGKSLEVCLDTSKNSYGEWIKGEGSDITIDRSQETNKVSGAHLPLYAKTLMIGGDLFPLIQIDLETGKVEIETDKLD